jgi:signal transduction histidine kinase
LSLLKTKMMMRISHEFRTPLAVIQSSTELLTRYHDRLTAERRDQHMVSIRSSIEKVTDMLDEIARVFRGQLQMAQPRFHSFNLRHLCGEVCKRMKALHPANEFVIEGDVPALVSDEMLLTTVIEQLLLNSIKYSQAGKPIRVILASENEQATLTVRDEGIGIPANDQPHIFEPFYRGSNTGAIPGIGVGLSTVKDMIALLSGRINIESTEGQGASFTITLPLTVS